MKYIFKFFHLIYALLIKEDALDTSLSFANISAPSTIKASKASGQKMSQNN